MRFDGLRVDRSRKRGSGLRREGDAGVQACERRCAGDMSHHQRPPTRSRRARPMPERTHSPVVQRVLARPTGGEPLEITATRPRTGTVRAKTDPGLGGNG